MAVRMAAMAMAVEVAEVAALLPPKRIPQT
jgi:hypothetical protein